jgi:hypothetical protein
MPFAILLPELVAAATPPPVVTDANPLAVPELVVVAFWFVPVAVLVKSVGALRAGERVARRRRTHKLRRGGGTRQHRKEEQNASTLPAHKIAAPPSTRSAVSLLLAIICVSEHERAAEMARHKIHVGYCA